ncbi:methylmalonyl-CoA epimerase [Bacillus sp. FJAT-42376]|uniref:methylmalonyl-CoA epimerase n=1 Tax=Bacillus sp. FJAT-42376 TaxID=2014076 RepID=UPI000F4D34C8|nr:methylmalonyl-CoA epimerase [Bacillus sp. FJAT-42376]AZB44894.1 methylmalonyl-CoA epimerase [Bacillus sp. FJAT-42376]
MINKVDHLGIAVKSIRNSLPLYEKTLGMKLIGEEEVPSQLVKVAFLDAGNQKIELLEPTSSESPVARFIEKRGEGIHHIAYKVENIEERIEELMKQGVAMIDSKPRIGAGGASIAFLHPKSTGGTLTELCEKKGIDGI